MRGWEFKLCTLWKAEKSDDFCATAAGQWTHISTCI